MTDTETLRAESPGIETSDADKSDAPKSDP